VRQALDEMKKLAAKFHLGFVFNAGGGEFTGPHGWRCQISTYDDEEDLAKLREALKEPPRP
jgi:hypothetical protein